MADWLAARYFPGHGPLGKDQLPTGPAGASHSVRRSRVPTSKYFFHSIIPGLQKVVQFFPGSHQAFGGSTALN